MQLRATTSLCTTCLRSVPAEVIRRGDQVVMTKRCAEHGASEVVVAHDADWYERISTYAARPTPPPVPRPVERGCPFDCGPCAQHAQTAMLPIVPITSACNLDCPICYTHNRNAGAFHMSEAELRAILGHIVRTDPERRIINLTGGEPTMHPDFARLVELCHVEGIRRITISTHGLGLLKDEALVARLAALDARVILSFDSFRDATNQALLGATLTEAKLRVLALLERHGVATTLLPVIARGHNHDELGAFVDLALGRDGIRSLELHTMTFTGQGGRDFDAQARYTPDQVLADLEAQTAGRLRKDDFVPSPAAHPTCYQVAYLLRIAPDRWLPFARFMSWDEQRAMLAGMLYLEPGPAAEMTLRDVIDRLWTDASAGEDTDLVLAALRGVIDTVFAPDLAPDARLRASERWSKAIYVHAHMDETTFDTDRIKLCCVGIREPDGRNIPSCAYNVLYRNRDPRFAEQPAPALITLGRGRPAS
ncbi:MAG: radical SAM protein [Deltaproteobacteria bacterium]|nr:radical SAM protein [Deltaproteobacteria bacterium]